MKTSFKRKVLYTILIILGVPIIIFVILLSFFAYNFDCDSEIARLNFQNKDYTIVHEQVCFVDMDEKINGVTWNLYRDGIFKKKQVGSFVVGTYDLYPTYKTGRENNFFGPNAKITLELNSGDKYCYRPYENAITPWTEECTWEAMRLVKKEISMKKQEEEKKVESRKKEISFKEIDNDLIKKAFVKNEDTIVLRQYPEVTCDQPSSDALLCDGIVLNIEIDLIEPTDWEEMRGYVYVRGYLNDKKVGELKLTKVFNPFAGDGGGVPATEYKEEDHVFILKKPFEKNIYIEYTDDIWNYDDAEIHDDNPGYRLYINDSISSYGRRILTFTHMRNGELSLGYFQ